MVTDATEYLGMGFMELVESWGSDASVVRSARVSFSGDRESRPPDQDAKLIRYLLKHGHWSPFEHCGLTVHVEAPIFVARQWMRHRSQSFNEVSGRYTKMEPKYYYPPTFRRQSPSNRQASDGEVGWRESYTATHILAHGYNRAWQDYERLLELGVSREQARAILPLGLRTRYYASMNLRSALHFIGDRDHEDAQEEIAIYARGLSRIISVKFPMTWEAWRENQE